MKIKDCLKSLMSLIFLILLLMPSCIFAFETYIASCTKGQEDALSQLILENIAKQLKLKLGIQLKYHCATFARNLLLTQQGINDLMIILTKQPERMESLHYIEPHLFNLNVAFVVKKGNHEMIQNYDDLYGLRIGAFRGANYFTRFFEDKKLNKSYANSLEQDINKLLLNRLDTVIVAEHTALDKMWKLNLLDKLEFSDYTYREPNPVYIVLSKKAPIIHQLNKIEPVIQNMIESGELRAIIEQFYIQRDLAVPDLWPSQD